jgi:chemotaxis protein CheD
MLPTHPLNPRTQLSLAASRRYVDFAIRDLATQFDSLGALPGDVRVKLFGGADVLARNSSSTRPTVGRLNCEAALRTLNDCRFEIAASSLGGNTGMQILFNTLSGEVLLKRLG